MGDKKLILLAVFMPMMIFGFRFYLANMEKPLFENDNGENLKLNAKFFDQEIRSACDTALEQNIISIIVILDPERLCPGNLDEPYSWIASPGSIVGTGTFGSILLISEDVDPRLAKEVISILGANNVITFSRAGNLEALAGSGLFGIVYSFEHGQEWADGPSLPGYDRGKFNSKLRNLVLSE